MVERRFFSAAAIAGSIAEVIYPVPQGLRGRVIDRMDRFLLNTIVESAFPCISGRVHPDPPKAGLLFACRGLPAFVRDLGL